MLSILFLIPLITLSILGIKATFYEIYANYKYGFSHHEFYKEISDFNGIIFYLSVICRRNIKFKNSIVCDIFCFLLLLGKVFSPVIIIVSLGRFHLATQLEFLISTTISLPIIAFYYLLKFQFGKINNELYVYLNNQDEKGVFEWIEKYKTHFLFKLTVQRYENSYFQNIYQKWELHKELQYQIAKNPVNIKRSKL